jgi:hypothetical protein
LVPTLLLVGIVEYKRVLNDRPWGSALWSYRASLNGNVVMVDTVISNDSAFSIFVFLN